VGIFGLPTPASSVDIAAIAAQMRPAVEMWFSAHVRIYDPTAGEAGIPLLVLDSLAGGALVQPIRSPTRIEQGGQATAILGIRFQIKEAATFIEGQRPRSGLIVRVVDGGQSPELQELPFSLTEAVDSSLRWDRIMDAVLLAS
jgi:hypothetical protein